MSDFAAFALQFGGLLALMALSTAWLFRTSSSPLWTKLAMPALMVATACYAPWAVNDMLGFPITVSMADLPERAELVAFAPRDEEQRVDLWLATQECFQFWGCAANDGPRAYETVLTPSLKKTLREAGETIGRGGRAVLTKHGAKVDKGHGSDALAISADDQTTYVLDPSSLSTLPPKE